MQNKQNKSAQKKTQQCKVKAALCLLVFILLISSLCTACQSNAPNTPDNDDDDIVIAITLMNYGFPFFQDMLAMAKLTADELGVQLIDLDGKGSMENQVNIMNDFLYAMDVDVICLNPVDSDAIGNLVLEANEMGVPVVTVDVGTGGGHVDAHIASNNVEIGRVAARYTVERLTQKYGSAKGTVIAIGYPQISSMRQRVEGFEEVLSEYPSIELLIRNPIKLNSDQNLRLMEDLLQSFPEGTVDVVFGASGTTASGLVAATEAAERNDFLLISVDHPPEILNKLEDEDSVLVATVVQFPTQMAKTAIEICVKIAKGEPIDEKVINTEIELVTKDTINDYLDRMEDIEEMIRSYKY